MTGTLHDRLFITSHSTNHWPRHVPRECASIHNIWGPTTSYHCIRHFGDHLSKMADISKKIGLSQKLRGAEFQCWLYVYVLWGIDFIESIAEYIMPLHPPFWKPFKKHGGHVQSNTSISETKRRRAVKFDSTSRFCGAYTCRKVLCRMCQYQVSTILTFMTAIL